MELSARAENLLAELARQQGLKALAFDEDGLIPIRLDGGLEIAIGYSPANDALFLLGLVEPAPDPDRLRAWTLFARNTDLAERRTRLACDPASGALILVRDAYAAGLDYGKFEAMMDRFIHDLAEQQGMAGPAGPVGTAAPRSVSEDEVMIFRL